ncbi:hypothetical protein ILUMI_14616, partial [Ignelater luminosus]
TSHCADSTTFENESEPPELKEKKKRGMEYMKRWLMPDKLEENAEDLLNNRINNLSKIILKCISEKSYSIKVEARKSCRDATEKIRNHALEMFGMIRFLKMEYTKTVRELLEIKNNQNLKVEKVEKIIIREEMNYANAVIKKPETTFAVKISAKETKNLGKVEDLLKTSVQPSKLKIPIAKLKKIKSGGVIIECVNKHDVEKLKAIVDTSQELKSKEIIKGNPRIILQT